MPAIIGQGVTLQGINDPKYNHTMNVSGTVTQADVGKAVALDTAADATVRLAAAGDKIKGALFSYENRVTEGIKVGAVARKGYFPFTYTGTAPTRGHGVVGGANPGTVAGSGAEATEGAPQIWAIDTVNKIALVAIGL